MVYSFGIAVGSDALLSYGGSEALLGYRGSEALLGHERL